METSEILLLTGTSGDGRVVMAVDGSGWNHLDQSCSCYLGIASLARRPRRKAERGDSIHGKTERVGFLSSFLASCSSRCLREIILTVTILVCNTEGDAVTLTEEEAERHYGTPPLQPKESAIHSYLMWSKLSLITRSLMLMSSILGCVHRSVGGNHRAQSRLH